MASLGCQRCVSCLPNLWRSCRRCRLFISLNLIFPAAPPRDIDQRRFGPSRHYYRVLVQSATCRIDIFLSCDVAPLFFCSRAPLSLCSCAARQSSATLVIFDSSCTSFRDVVRCKDGRGHIVNSPPLFSLSRSDHTRQPPALVCRAWLHW